MLNSSTSCNTQNSHLIQNSALSPNCPPMQTGKTCHTYYTVFIKIPDLSCILYTMHFFRSAKKKKKLKIETSAALIVRPQNLPCFTRLFAMYILPPNPFVCKSMYKVLKKKLLPLLETIRSDWPELQ